MPTTLFVKPRRRIDRVFIHCSASDVPAHDSVDVIREWHLARGFDDIGYHFFIHKNGDLSPGRDIERTPAAQHGHNLRTIAICLHGLKREKFTAAQEKTLQALCSEINSAYLKQVSFHGHCEVSPKACPVIDYKRVLRLDAYGSLGLESQPVVSAAGQTDDLPRLTLGDSGEAVKKLQSLLHVTVDGDYGPETLAAVKAFKRQNGLYPSGIVTPQVWQLLMRPVLESIRTVELSALPDLQTGSRGPSVAFLQELLFIRPDGIFGPATARAVRAFKKAHMLYASDLVKKHVWKLLLDVRSIEHYA